MRPHLWLRLRLTVPVTAHKGSEWADSAAALVKQHWSRRFLRNEALDREALVTSSSPRSFGQHILRHAALVDEALVKSSSSRSLGQESFVNSTSPPSIGRRFLATKPLLVALCVAASVAHRRLGVNTEGAPTGNPSPAPSTPTAHTERTTRSMARTRLVARPRLGSLASSHPWPPSHVPSCRALLCSYSKGKPMVFLWTWNRYVRGTLQK